MESSGIMLIYRSLFQKTQTELMTPLCTNVFQCGFAFQELDSACKAPVFSPSRLQFEYLVPVFRHIHTHRRPLVSVFRHSHTHTTPSEGHCWGQGKPVCFSAVQQSHTLLSHFLSLSGRSHLTAPPLMPLHAPRLH